MIFVNSMSDLFHPSVSFSFIDDVMSTTCAANWHTYQILTKRPERAIRYFRQPVSHLTDKVWLGVSVENKETVWRINSLKEISVRVRFVSFEPLLESIGEIDLTGIHWAIIGGESGPKARPFNIEWAREIIRQCKAAKVPVFMKQVGSNSGVGGPLSRHGGVVLSATIKRAHLKSRKGGDPAEWPIDLRIREYPV